MRRRWFAWILVLVLSVSMLAACGTKDDEEEVKKPKIVKGDIGDMVDAMQKTEAGTFSFGYELNGDEVHTSLSFEVAFDGPEELLAVSVQYKGEDQEKKVDTKSVELIRVKDGMCYVNMAAINEEGEIGELLGASSDATFSGWFAIPLPKDMPEYKAPTAEQLLGDLVYNLLQGLPQEGINGDYKVAFKGKGDYAIFLGNLRDYVKKDLKKTVQSLSGKNENVLKSIDLNAYAQDLINMYREDLHAVVREYGDCIDVTEQQLDAILDEVKNQDLSALLEQYLKSTENDIWGEGVTEEELDSVIAEIVEALDKSIAHCDEDQGEFEPVDLHFYTDDNGYAIDMKVTFQDSFYLNDMQFHVRMDPGKFSVETPKDLTSLKELADTIFGSYLSYVEKSRRTSDVSSLDEMMAATEYLAADPDFNVQPGTWFRINIDNGKITFFMEDRYSNVLDEWKLIALYGSESHMAKSDLLQKGSGVLDGTVTENGRVQWKIAQANDSLREFLKWSSDFAEKLGLE
ncbi:MAG: hypothetical protein IK055_03150 [Lachnospiraceae bacterium]|nr:hypothetical protein [Lachnospiraceae bacterium]